MKSRDKSKTQAKAVSRADSLPSPSRRRLLKGGATALPVILTLHSGAALARTSNLLSATDYFETDELGRTLCVDATSVCPVDTDCPVVVDDYSGLPVYDYSLVPEDEYSEIYQIYDLGDPPHAVINVIRGEAEGRIYYVNKDDKDSGNSIHPGLMCEQGGQYWYKPSSGPWEVVDVPQGFVASSMAASSFAMEMTENLI
jgi:hypothetical protein